MHEQKHRAADTQPKLNRAQRRRKEKQLKAQAAEKRRLDELQRLKDEKRSLRQVMEDGAKVGVVKHMPEPAVYYECDPLKHTECSKKNCFVNGGPCHQTKRLEFAKQPVEKAHMIVPVDEATRIDLMRKYAQEVDETIKSRGGDNSAGRT